jgi:3-oxoadipate enol-lactonase
LFIVGEKDGTAPAAMAKLHDKLHDKLAGSRFVTLPGAGHISNMDRASEFNSALRDFLTKA